VRAFIALELGSDLRQRIGGLVDDLRPRMPGARWVRPEGVHLTLRFLGATTAAEIDRMEGMLRKATEDCPPTTAMARGLGVFPDRGRPRILWLGLEVAAPVLGLQASCEAAAVSAGFQAEGRPFRPHLTLGRWRDPSPRPELPTVDLGETTLDTLTVFRSELRSGGARYTPLLSLKLAGDR
jgi:2'-5' RNA ligase